MKIVFDLSQEEADLLTNAAHRLGVRPEELARAALTDLLGTDREEFQRAAEYVLNKNRELYQRLS